VELSRTFRKPLNNATTEVLPWNSKLRVTELMSISSSPFISPGSSAAGACLSRPKLARSRDNELFEVGRIGPPWLRTVFTPIPIRPESTGVARCADGSVAFCWPEEGMDLRMNASADSSLFFSSWTDLQERRVKMDGMARVMRLSYEIEYSVAFPSAFSCISKTQFTCRPTVYTSQFKTRVDLQSHQL